MFKSPKPKERLVNVGDGGGEGDMVCLRCFQNRLVGYHEEGNAEWVKVEQSAEDVEDPQVAVVHPLHDHEEGHAE